MYQTNEYVTAELGLRHAPGHRRAAGRRVWLAVIPTVAALLVLLFVLAAACRVGSDEPDPPAGAAGTQTAEPSTSPGPSAPGPEAGNGGGAGSGGAAGGGNPGGGAGSGSGGNPDPEEPVEPEPVEPLSVQASLNSVAPGGSCSASGTLGVSGGEYPVTVDYEWRRVRLVNGQPNTETVSPALSVTFDGPGAKTVQINNLPSDGPNLWIAVTGPKQESSNWFAYDSCGNGPDVGPGGIAP